MPSKLPALVVLLIFIGNLAAQETPVSIQRGITYAEVDGQPLQLDLAVPPSGEGPFPLIVCFHGGGWSAGNRSDLRWMLTPLARQGFVAATVSYRFAPKYPLPAQIHDAKAAVRFLRANAAKYHIDPDRIGATGQSAGGHLAMMLALTDAKDDLEGTVGVQGVSSKVRAAVNLSGSGDLRGEARPVNEEARKTVLQYYKTTPEKLWLGVFGTDDRNAPIFAKASPITYADAKDPPILTLIGTDDEFIPIEKTRRFDAAMKAAGAPHTLVEFPGQRHNFTKAAMSEAMVKLIAFFKTHLSPAGEN